MGAQFQAALLLSATLSLAIAATPNVAYFRNHNMDRSSRLNVSNDAASVTLNEWATTINLFDSPQDVRVVRLDVTGKPKSIVTLFNTPLELANGPMYFFHNSSNLTVTSSGDGKSYSMPKTQAVVWVSKGSCVQLSLELSEDGEASVIAVASGTVRWSAPPSAGRSPSCSAGIVLVGAGLSAGGGGGSGGPGWVYNEVKYKLNNSASCKNPLTHGTNGYSQTDEPIGPLAAHFHTRGALYYNQYGSSKYNDEAAPNDTIYTGELRFVDTGVHYGPEEMDADTCFVASVHEADPAAVNPVSESPSSECPFACMNKLKKGQEPSRCIRE